MITPLTCAFCSSTFDRGYRICAARAARPQFCSKPCQTSYFKALAKERMKAAFWLKVAAPDANGCRAWTGRLHAKGYGVIDFGGRPVLAHRMAYLLATGVEPGDKSVCHSCDNPPCCSPAHLWLGTHKENMLDAARKGRIGGSTFKGEDHPSARLSEEDVSAIRASTEGASVLASRYSVTGANISRIRARKTWRHI